MRTLIAYLFLAAVAGCIAVAAPAVGGTPQVSAGLRVGPLMGRTDDTDKVSGRAEVFARYRLQKSLEAEVGAGYGRLSGSSFATDLATVGGGLVYLAPQLGSWQPLAHAGLTGVRHDVDEFPAWRSSNSESIAWSAAVPVGLGARLLVSPTLAVEATGTYTYTLRDDFDGRTDIKGNDWLFSAGISLVFGRFQAPPVRPPAAPVAAPEPQPESQPQLGPVQPVAPPVEGAPADRDEDGLTDREETRQYFTNPLMADSDMDELGDADEVRVHGTDPNRADTDGDGTADGAEVTAGRDPLVADVPEPELEPPLEPVVWPAEPSTSQVVSFATGGASLSPAARSALGQVLDYLLANPQVQLSVRGYSDSVGGWNANLRLAGRRSEAVRDFLVAGGVEAWRLTVEALGEADPVGDNSTRMGRRANRRVELVPMP